jgi:hypothetical protein
MAIPFSARYFGEFIPGVTRLRYFYKMIAYAGNNVQIAESGLASDFGPPVLDGDHGISLQWQPIVGANYYVVFKRRDVAPDTDSTRYVFYRPTGSETGIFDVGYPATTRNPFLNPGAHVAGQGVTDINGIDGPVTLFPGPNIRIQNHAPSGQSIEISAYPAGANAQIQFNGHGLFAATPSLTWENNRLEIAGSLNVTGFITTPNRFEVGSLQVNGVATFGQNVSIAGTLNVQGISTLRNRVQIGGAGIARPLTILNIPTSQSGLQNGDVWSSGGTLHIVHSTPGGED